MRSTSFVGVIFLLVYAGSATAQIMPYTDNPCYWQYNGEPVLLLGGSGDDNLFQWAGDEFGDRLVEHLDLLVSVGGNYVRNAMNSRYDAVNGYNDAHMAYPFKRLASGKYNLDRWNPDYRNRLDTFLKETESRGIIVQLELWDRDTLVGKDPWARQPWNPDNNVNYTYDQISLTHGKTGNQMPFFEAVLDESQDDRLKQYQDRYIRKILETSLPYNNVLYQINNESPLAYAVSDYWAAMIHQQAQSRNKSVQVCDSRRFHRPSPYVTTEFRDWKNPDVYYPILHPELYTFCDISQNGGNTGQTHYDNLLWYRSQLLEHSPRPLNHVKVYTFLWPTGTSWFDRIEPKEDSHARQRFWRSIFGGSAAVRHHRDKGGWGLGLNTKAQADIQSARMLASAVDIFDMEPNTGILSEREENEAYAMSTSDQQTPITVYFTGEGDRSVRLKLPLATARLRQQWLDIDNRTWLPATELGHSETHMLCAPGTGQWAVFIASQDNGGVR